MFPLRARAGSAALMLSLTAVFCVLFAPGAGAQTAGLVEPPPSARAAALQGGLAAPDDNASIYLNPAGTVMLPRYQLSGFGHLRQNTPAPERRFGVSIVDSTGGLGGGIGWVRDLGGRDPADDFALALAQRWLGNTAIGVGVHYRIDRTRTRRTDWNFDLGLLYDPLEGRFRLGLVAYDLLNPPDGVLRERAFAGGLASRIADYAEVTADLHYTPGLPDGERIRWNAGLEGFIGPWASVRGGYGQDPAGPQHRNQWSIGAGGGIPGQFRLEYAFVKEVAAPVRTHLAEISFYMR